MSSSRCYPVLQCIAFLVGLLFLAVTIPAPVPAADHVSGDMDGDDRVDLNDAILSLLVQSGLNPAQVRPDFPSAGVDVNLDGRIGLAEAIHALQRLERTTVVRQYQTLELVFTAQTSPVNPFDTYLLKLEVTDPDGNSFTLDGFYDGDGFGGQDGAVWKARLCPYMTGTWSWRTIVGDEPDSGLNGRHGQFVCVEGTDLGGLVRDGRYFRFQSGIHVFLQGNFLDFIGGLVPPSSHTFMSELVGDENRDALLARQYDTHAANKINVYFANKGDYGGVSVTPWVGTGDANDKSRMDLARWKRYDNHLLSFKQNNMFAEMWFFADDSNFGALPEADKNRLFRYAMARTSAFTHTLYVIALEWGEGWTETMVNRAGDYLQAHNPWNRLLSVHNHTDWPFSGQSWPDFIATQCGNDCDAYGTNRLARLMHANEELPHLSEEYGILFSDSDARLRANVWASFLGGAAGGGTGSDIRSFFRFLNQSRIPFWRMEDANDLLADGDRGSAKFCLAESGHHYLVYTTSGSFTLDVNGSELSGYWFDPTDPDGDLGPSFAVAAGSQTFVPAETEMVLWITDGSNLGSGITHPTADSGLVQEIIAD